MIRKWLRQSLVIIALAAIGGCGGGSGSNVTPTQPAPPVFDTRASNTSCIAPQFPNLTDSGLQLSAAFPQLPAIARLVNLVQPASEDDTWYAISQVGQVYRFANDASATSLDLFLDLSANTYSAANESGLLGIAFHPAYASNGQVFIYYMPEQTSARLSRFTRSTDGSGLDIDSEKIILTVGQPARNHNGGGLGFGRDGYLYLSLGDGGGANDTFSHGQNLSTLLGAMLRLDIDVEDDATPYTIPPDNPFADSASGLPEIYAYGLRNPWRWSFDSLTNELWLGDVGQNAVEEIDIINAGNNYGWPITEGNSCLNSSSCDRQGLTAPVLDYQQDETGGCSVTGGYVYRGEELNLLQGVYVFGDFCSGAIYGASPTDDAYQRDDLLQTSLSISSFAQDNQGELYVLSLNGGEGGGIYKLLSADPGNEASAIQQTLSQTGCFTDVATQVTASGVMPYPVNSQLWSDGASKNRYFAIPDDTFITVSDDGDFEFPSRSVLIKSFLHNNVPVETRLLMKHDNGWAGYSYAWNDQGTDASLLEDGNKLIIDSGYTHIFPGRTECLQCHLPAAGFSLGLEAAQLNQEGFGAENGTNYLTYLEQLGYLSNNFSASQKQTKLSAVDDENASIEARARSYLHSNCAGCHRPGGPIAGIDLRFSTSLTDMGICNVTPQYGDRGIADARLLNPGNSQSSLLTQRMRATDNDRMPPLASDVIDAQATDLVESWIQSLIGCDA